MTGAVAELFREVVLQLKAEGRLDEEKARKKAAELGVPWPE